MRFTKLLIGLSLLITLGMLVPQPFGAAGAIKAYNTENLVQLKAVTAEDDAVFEEKNLLKPFHSGPYRCENLNLTLLEPPPC